MKTRIISCFTALVLVIAAVSGCGASGTGASIGSATKSASGMLPSATKDAENTEAATTDPGDDIPSLHSYEEVLAAYEALVVNRLAGGTYSLDFDYGESPSITAYLQEHGNLNYTLDLSTTISNDIITFELTYEPIAIYSPTAETYPQIANVNAYEPVNTRAATYDNFASDSFEESFTVLTSDALVYCLEHGYRPDIQDEGVAGLYETMKCILRAMIDDAMGDMEKAKAIYDYLILNTAYDRSESKGSSLHRAAYLEGVLEDQVAVCDGFAKAYVCLCVMEGIPCVRVVGDNHAWNKIRIGSSWYVVDVTSGNGNSSGEELLTYKYFMITDEAESRKAVPDANSYPDIVCDTVYDVYEAMGLKATSREETSRLFAAALEYCPEGATTCFDIEYDYDITVSDLMQDVLRDNNYTESISYIDHGGIILFIIER